MIERKALGLALARKAIDAILEAATSDRKAAIAVAVTDDYGDLIAFARMDGVTPGVVKFARRKAYTAAVQRSDTAAWAARIKELGRSAADWADPELVAWQGGLVIRDSGHVVGGIGVSGRTSAEDEELSRVGMKAAGLSG